MRSYKDIHVVRKFKGVIGEFLLAFEIEMKEIKEGNYIVYLQILIQIRELSNFG